jgi:hypothetical protein
MELKLKLKLFLRHNKQIYNSYSFFKTRFLGDFRNYIVSNTNLCIEGYPSSANTYFQYLMNYLLIDVNFAHHTHSLATVKSSIARSLPTIIIIRKPIDAISSRVIRFNIDQYYAIHEYIKFYEYVLNNIDNDIFIITFEDIINNKFEKLFNYLDDHHILYHKKKIEEANQYSKDTIEYKDRNIKYNPFPNKQREYKKNILKKELKTNNDFLKANKVHEQIIRSIR